MSFIDYFLHGYGLGFFIVFWLPVGIISAILMFETGEALWKEVRRWQDQSSAEADNRLAELTPRFDASPPDTALRRSFYRPLDQFLMQPFSRGVNRVRHGS